MTTLGAKRPLHFRPRELEANRPMRVPIYLCSPSGQDYSSEGFAHGSRSEDRPVILTCQADVRKALAADKT